MHCWISADRCDGTKRHIVWLRIRMLLQDIEARHDGVAMRPHALSHSHNVLSGMEHAGMNKLRHGREGMGVRFQRSLRARERRRKRETIEIAASEGSVPLSCSCPLLNENGVALRLNPLPSNEELLRYRASALHGILAHPAPLKYRHNHPHWIAAAWRNGQNA